MVITSMGSDNATWASGPSVEHERTCALEYNVVGWGRMAIPPQAAMGVFVRGANGRLAAVRLYDDVDRPLAERPPC